MNELHNRINLELTDSRELLDSLLWAHPECDDFDELLRCYQQVQRVNAVLAAQGRRLRGEERETRLR